ncbi:MAG: hypothetical protein C4315_13390 [Chloroflexota bacterium]
MSLDVWWGILTGFDGTTYRATVRPVGSPTGAVVVAASRGIPAAEMVPGRRVLVAGGAGSCGGRLALKVFHVKHGKGV